ncbi:MAG: anthranilate phosphoribosyltransferase [Cyanobacteria bacterium RYN_339]|nr:anthranilate phosphoribosyltransferase [Cyanobacteria bacterium RYN_339]
MLKPYLKRVIDGEALSRDEMAAALGFVMAGEATAAQIGAFMVAMRMKGETVEEIVGAATAMRARCTPIRTPAGIVVDTCGTGGDHSNTFNISTTAAFVLAGCGAIVAKHGSHSNTSASGSADVLKELGVNITAAPDVVERCLEACGMGFLYAPALHGAMKHAVAPRKELGIRSFFNVLGPLSNPAAAQFQLIGVYDKALIPILVPALGALGLKGAMVVHGEDGLDELSTCAPTHVGEWRDGAAHYYTLDARELGFPRAQREDLLGGSPAENAAIAQALFMGRPGPTRDIVVLNAAAAVLIAGLAPDWPAAIAAAEASIDKGHANAKLRALACASNALPTEV